MLTNKPDVDTFSAVSVWLWIKKKQLSLLNMNKVSNHHPVTVCKWRRSREVLCKWLKNPVCFRAAMLHFFPSWSLYRGSCTHIFCCQLQETLGVRSLSSVSNSYSHEAKKKVNLETHSSLSLSLWLLTLPDNLFTSSHHLTSAIQHLHTKKKWSEWFRWVRWPEEEAADHQWRLVEGLYRTKEGSIQWRVRIWTERVWIWV